ncbi:hypothetical protein SM0020_23477 [Sinorhizobium meliloti CCNWSX0020]|uniref:RNA polymerase sigma factor 54 DNA-binding domain-containing protein n=1 Tax=Sinorhizobium meliloti CCNWSX0020 TaxID=1107881 RepID=H0G5D3_RHIML|nr:hypothetical protein SM0020_23477 [Sinorhizobium meliloti CCNWSX0020]
MFSDDDNVDVLKKTGVDIARRTVAKYRGAMNIHPLSKAAARSVHCRGPRDLEGCRQPASTLEQAGPVAPGARLRHQPPGFWAALFCSPAAGMHSRSQQLSICGRNSVVPDREEGAKRSRYPEQPVQRHRLSSGHSACRRPVTRASTHGGNSLSDF